MKGHYTKKCIKCSDCQQWGHGSKKSRHCKSADKTETVGTIVADNSNGFVMSELAHITFRADICLTSVGNSKGRSVPLTHHVFTEDAGWTDMPSAPHPTLAMSTTASPKDHDQFGHPIADTKRMNSKMQTIVCDTGCMSTAIPPTAAYMVGFKRKDFIPVVSRMNGAGRSDLGVIGAVVMEFNMTGDSGLPTSTKQLCTFVH